MAQAHRDEKAHAAPVAGAAEVTSEKHEESATCEQDRHHRHHGHHERYALFGTAETYPRYGGRAAPGTDADGPVSGLAGDLALPIGCAASALLIVALMLTDGRAHLWWCLGAFALLSALVAALGRMRWAPAVAAVCWLFFDGFIVNRDAELTWNPTGLESLAVLLFTGLTGAAATALAHAVRHGAPARHRWSLRVRLSRAAPPASAEQPVPRLP
ncbi:hypothetical protein [Streptomyces sp. MST-110588]|uniref:hypothetical protein n=1 Tax=Streptomyces sp. MST-110588 TaxID=2833628 RepID=UPI001F5C6623|nr:hypothetical protein [Streptomyces sp. MST-110588]UNO38833.1 hypothetical protein KGS77_03220 [Streptomyces sp. MST-110588]